MIDCEPISLPFLPQTPIPFTNLSPHYQANQHPSHSPPQTPPCSSAPTSPLPHQLKCNTPRPSLPLKRPLSHSPHYHQPWNISKRPSSWPNTGKSRRNTKPAIPVERWSTWRKPTRWLAYATATSPSWT